MPRPVHTCLVCQSTRYLRDGRSTQLINVGEPFAVVRCAECGFRWLDPQPTDEEYDALYEAAYFNPNGQSGACPEFFHEYLTAPHQYEANEVVMRQPWFRARLTRLRNLSPSATTILDVGAATGDFLAEAKSQGWEVEGVEPSRHACQRAKQKHDIDLWSGSFFDFDAGGKKYDVVHLNHVFEHLTAPIRALDIFRQWMHADSLLVIEVPNQFESVVSQLQYIKRGGQPRDLYSIHHPCFYGTRQLTRLLQSGGFELVKTTTHFPERFLLSAYWRVMGAINLIADLISRRGYYIEVVAKPYGPSAK